jgi:hypothetical protein
LAANKEPYVLLSYYDKLYLDRYGKRPVINRYREKWGMLDVIESVGLDRGKELLDYYFKTTNPGHSITWFLNNFDNLDEMLEEKKKDRELREKLRLQTKQMIEEREANEH